MTHYDTANPNALSDEQLLEGLQSASLPADSFHHREHLRAGWLYLERWPLSEALARFSTDLQALASALGAPEMFHATITWALLFALDAQRRALGPGHTWDKLAKRSPELLDWRTFLGRYYTDATLWSDEARASFLMPDRLILQELPLAGGATRPSPGTAPDTAD